MEHNKIPKDTVEELFDEVKRQAEIRKWNAPNIDYVMIEALTTAYNKGVEVGRVEKLKKAGNFVGELYQSGNMGDNEYELLTEFFNEELGIPTPLSEVSL